MASKWGDGEELAPFASFSVFKLGDSRNKPVGLARKIRTIIEPDQHRTAFSQPAVAIASIPAVARFNYREERRPSWLRRGADVTFFDVSNHLVVVYVEAGFVAVYCSEVAASREVVRAVKKGKVAGLVSMPPADMEEALVHGPARTLWMGSVQRNSGQRADAKVLAGSDLTYVLNPLEDQGYTYSSVRCDHGSQESHQIVGISPPKSRVWLRPAESIEDFVEAASPILAALQTPGSADGRPSFRTVLASREPTRPLVDAFELSVTHPDLDEEAARESQSDSATRRRWAEEAEFSVLATSGSAFSVEVQPEFCGCTLDIDVKQNSISVSCAEGHKAPNDPCEEARTVLGKDGWVVVRYASGHTWMNGQTYEMRLRPVVFDPPPAFVGLDPAVFDMREEKPRKAVVPKVGAKLGKDRQGRVQLAPTLWSDALLKDGPSQGRTQRSLFNWLVHHRPTAVLPKSGWLACDDGSGERADFIHWDPQAKDLRLIHVKACHSTGKGISLLDFEQVVAQAIKNLRWFDLVELARLVEAPSKNVEKLVWKPGGAAGDRQQFASALAQVGDDYHRHVVVVQPAMSEAAWDEPKNGPARELLSTLLAGARSSCQDLNATFTLVGRK